MSCSARIKKFNTRGIQLLTWCDYSTNEFLPLNFTYVLHQPVIWPILVKGQLIRSVPFEVIWVP